MYQVTETNERNMYYTKLYGAVAHVVEQVKEAINEAYENNAIDKYGVEDALWKLEEGIRKNMGYSYPDLEKEWSITQL